MPARDVQQKDNNKAKPYLVKQVRNVILKYKFGDMFNAKI